MDIQEKSLKKSLRSDGSLTGFTVDEIIKATKGKRVNRAAIYKVTSVSTDSRTIKSGELFVAIPGERYDGHDFIGEAVKKGAAGVVISWGIEVYNSLLIKRSQRCRLSDSNFPSSPKEPKQSSTKSVSSGYDFKSGNKAFFVAVKDTLKALGDLARFHREKFDIPIIAVTGSNGKTTAKEMIEMVLKNGWHPLKNSGTENNLIGVPLTLFKLADRYESIVVELGMNRRGGIKRLAEIARPNIGVITNIGPSHLEYLGGLNGVYAAKKELLDFLGRGDIALLNSDDALLSRFKRGDLAILRFGIKNEADFKAEGIKKEDYGWSFKVSGAPYSLRLAAYHDIYNALVAISIGSIFGIPAAKIKEALLGYVSLDNRMARGIIKGVEFIDDTYNSNPLSMRSAIATLAGYNSRGNKILVSGDMLELGRKSAYYHSEIGRLVADSGIDKFISVGRLGRSSFMAAKRKGMRDIWFCRTKEEAASVLNRIVRPNDVVLIKGSRKMQMEEVIKCFITSSTR